MLKITLTSQKGKNITVPKHFHYGIHQFLLENMSPSLVDTYYHRGFVSSDDRVYKLYTFSELEGDKRGVGENLIFVGKVVLYVNAYYPNLLENIQQNLQLREVVPFFNQQTCVVNAEIGEFDPIEDGTMYITQTMSPVLVRLSHRKENGKQNSRFFGPQDEEFLPIVRRNLYRKLSAVQHPVCKQLSIDQLSDADFHIEMAGGTAQQQIDIYSSGSKRKHFISKGYHATMLLSGKKEFIEMAVKTGIGEKNPSGFGMLNYKAW